MKKPPLGVAIHTKEGFIMQDKAKKHCAKDELVTYGIEAGTEGTIRNPE